AGSCRNPLCEQQCASQRARARQADAVRLRPLPLLRAGAAGLRPQGHQARRALHGERRRGPPDVARGQEDRAHLRRRQQRPVRGVAGHRAQRRRGPRVRHARRLPTAVGPHGPQGVAEVRADAFAAAAAAAVREDLPAGVRQLALGRVHYG
ncbi:unnamed protein product, partial [Pelagomonas calceolata]